jgi:hypothetical protein
MQMLFNLGTLFFKFAKDIKVKDWGIIGAVLGMVALLFTNFPAFLVKLLKWFNVWIFNLEISDVLDLIPKLEPLVGVYTYSAIELASEYLVMANYYAPLFEIFKYAVWLLEACIGLVCIALTSKIIKR